MTIYWRNPDTGLVEGLDENGRVQSIQKTMDSPFDSATKAGFTEVKREDGSLYYIQDGVTANDPKGWSYNPMIGAVIAGEIANGAGMSTLHRRSPEFPPYQVITRWMNKHQEFKEMIEIAIKERAYKHFEDTNAVAEEAYQRWKDDPDNAVQAAKLKIDALKFLIEKGDRDKFGSKPSNSEGGGIQIFIDTGITREPRDITPKKIEGV